MKTPFPRITLRDFPRSRFEFVSDFELREVIATLAAKRRNTRKNSEEEFVFCAFCAFSRLFPGFASGSRNSDLGLPLPVSIRG